jgi:hypothetical protein
MGCAGLFMPSGPSEREIKAMIDRNNRNLLRLQTDMFEEYVFNIMGSPQRLEGYSWGTVWLYRTAITKGAQTTPETDFTPLVFDRRGILLGWGRDFLATQRYRQSSVGGEGRPLWRDQGITHVTRSVGMAWLTAAVGWRHQETLGHDGITPPQGDRR